MSRDLLRIAVVSKRTGLAHSSIYAAIKRGEFPSPVKLGVHTVGWPSDSIDAWIEERIAASAKERVA